MNKQMRLEGGFEGRTNKLVDACYSFWQGGALPLINAVLTKQETVFNSNYWLFNQEALQEYLLICCQHPHGGFLDKPGKYGTLLLRCTVHPMVLQTSPFVLDTGIFIILVMH